MHRKTASPMSSCGLRRTRETAERSVKQMFSSWIHVADLHKSGGVGDTRVTAQTNVQGWPFYCENQDFKRAILKAK